MADYKSKFTGEQIDALLELVEQGGSGEGSEYTGKSKYTGQQIDELLGEVFDSTLQTKDVEVSEDTTITPDEGFLGLKEVNVKVQGGSGGGNTIEYRDVSGLNSTSRLHFVDYAAFVVKIEAEGTRMTVPAVQAHQFANSVGGEIIKAIATDLNAKSITAIGESCNVMTFREGLISFGLLDDYESCPIISEEEFYS